MSLVFNTLSRFVIAFFPRSKCLLISWLQSPSAVILEPMKIKSVTASTFSPSICREVMEPDAMTLVFWMLSFKPAFSLSSFTHIYRLFSSSSLYAIESGIICIFEVVAISPGNLNFSLWFIQPGIFLVMNSACKSDKKGDNIQAWRTLFPIWNWSVVPCPVLTVASWPTYRFLRR